MTEKEAKDELKLRHWTRLNAELLVEITRREAVEAQLAEVKKELERACACRAEPKKNGILCCTTRCKFHAHVDRQRKAAEAALAAWRVVLTKMVMAIEDADADLYDLKPSVRYALENAAEEGRALLGTLPKMEKK